MDKPNTAVPFIQSVYLDRRVWLDELGELTDSELRLLETEANGILEDASGSVARAISEQRDYGVMEKLTRVAGRFIYALEREQTARQKQRSFLEIYKELNAVTEERDALRRQLDHFLITAQ